VHKHFTIPAFKIKICGKKKLKSYYSHVFSAYKMGGIYTYSKINNLAPLTSCHYPGSRSSTPTTELLSSSLFSQSRATDHSSSDECKSSLSVVRGKKSCEEY
jgi:hypothetical protein